MKEEVAYQNKDITSKKAAEYFKNKSLSAYGLELPKIVGVRPTNLPAIEANELRLDNLFEFADGSVGIIDYESSYDGTRQKIKYLNYTARIAERYRMSGETLSSLRLIIIYTSDVDRRSVKTVYDLGCVRLEITPAFLSELNPDEILPEIRRKIGNGEDLSEDEQMRLIVLPLAAGPGNAKLETLRECVELAKRVQDEALGVFLLSAMVVFSDKIIDRETAEDVRRWIQMTKIGKLYEEEKKEAVRKIREEMEQALSEKDKALLEKNEALSEKDRLQADERRNIIRNLMLSTKMTDDEITKIVDVVSPAEVREMRRKLAG